MTDGKGVAHDKELQLALSFLRASRALKKDGGDIQLSENLENLAGEVETRSEAAACKFLASIHGWAGLGDHVFSKTLIQAKISEPSHNRETYDPLKTPASGEYADVTISYPENDLEYRNHLARAVDLAVEICNNDSPHNAWVEEHYGTQSKFSNMSDDPQGPNK